MSYTPQQLINMEECYLEMKSVIKTQQLYRNNFGPRDLPRKNCILHNVKKFQKEGTVHILKKSGRKKTGHSEENNDVVRICHSKSKEILSPALTRASSFRS